MLFLHISIIARVYRPDMIFNQESQCEDELSKIASKKLVTRCKSSACLSATVKPTLHKSQSYTAKRDPVSLRLRLVKPSERSSLVSSNTLMIKKASISEVSSFSLASSNTLTIKKASISEVSSFCPASSNILRIKRNQKKIFKILVITLLCFVFKSLPFIVTVLYNRISNGDPSTALAIITITSQIIFFSNNALNFFFYALYSKNFQTSAKNVFGKFRYGN
jgi:hypothetical protein